MTKKLLILLLALLGLTGTMRAVNYDLLVCGTQVTSDNAADLSVIDGVTGTVSFDASSNTLTLENATISCSTTHAIQTASMNGVTISVVGTNTVTTTYRYGLNMQGSGLTITGSGSLSILSPRASIRFNGTLAISGGVQLTAEATSVGNYACPIYAVGSSESSVVVSGAGTVVRLKGRDWPMHNVSSLLLNDGLQITAPEGAYLADNKYIYVGTTMVEDEWVVIMNPNLEQSVEGEESKNILRYDVSGDGSLTLTDLTMLANALVGKVNFPITSLTLSNSSLFLTKGANIRLAATANPSDADQTTLVWTTSNYLVATVDGTGFVTGQNAGTCVITVRTIDGSNLSATCQVTVTDPSGNANSYVDLGLPSGTLWAACNVGANKAEDYGNYFAWGETTGYNDGKTTFNWSTYIYCNGSQNTLTKYCQNSSYGYNGFRDTLTELESTDDAAYVNWGSNWRMPSKEQFEELINSSYTTTTLTTLNGVSGWLITSNTNANSIFLPTAGSISGTNLSGVGSFAKYWTRSLYTGGAPAAFTLDSSLNSIYAGSNYYSYRYYGFSIRPVRNQ